VNLPGPQTAAALGAVRALVHGFFLVSIAATSFRALGRLPVTIMHPPGAMEYLSWKLYDRLLTPGGMTALQWLLLVSLALSTVGCWTGLTAKTSAALVIFYQGILRSFGHFNHDEMVALYCLGVLAFSPCGDAFSIDRLRRAPPARPGFAYGYPIFLMQLVMAWAYCTAGVLKLRLSGPAYFDPDNLPTLAIRHSLDNLHDTEFKWALELPAVRRFLPAALGVALAWEVTFPLAVFFRRLRWPFLAFGLVFHLSTMLLMNITFPVQVAMYVVFVDWPAVGRWCRRRLTGAAHHGPPPTDPADQPVA
jgi:hypothetical protein